jgi:hypothetical protein
MKLWKCDAVGPIEGLLAVQVVVMLDEVVISVVGLPVLEDGTDTPTGQP